MKLKQSIPVFLIILAAALWGTAGVFVRRAACFALSEMQLVFLRAALSATMIAAILLFKNRSLFRIRLREFWLFAAAGIFSIVMFNYCYYKTMALTSLSVAAVLLYTAPFFVMVLSVVLFHETITSKKIFACVTAFFGCCLVTGVLGQHTPIGKAAILFGVITGFGYSLYTIFSRLLLNRGYTTLTITFYTFLVAALGCIPFINAVKTAELAVSSGAVFITVFLMALLNTVVPYLLYTVGLKGIEPSAAPIIAMIEPVVATLIGTFVYHEMLTASGVAGMMLVLASVAVLNMKAGMLHGNHHR